MGLAVSVEGITCIRSGNVILDDLFWQMPIRRHTALLGANGSGKTTLLKIITGYEWPSTGSVEVMGHRLGRCDVRLLRRSIGYVSSALEHRLPVEDSALDVVLSGVEATLGVYREFTPEERSFALGCMEAVRGDGFRDRRYGLLSQGEQQRTLIARALMAKPGLLILDEPCAGLDPGSRRAFLNDLATLAAGPNAPSVIFVTHHIEEIGPWLEEVLVIKQGRKLTQGPRHSVLTAEVMSDAFGAACTVEASGGHYWLRFA